MKKKKLLCIAAILSILATGCSSPDLNINKNTESSETTTENIAVTNAKYSDNKTSYYFKTGNKYFQKYSGDSFDDFYITGVNIGSGEPNSFPGEMGISKDEYLDWFNSISEMGVNTIRVYTILSPDFYDALYEFNSSAKNQLYLFQGVWYDEDTLAENNNAFDVLDSVNSDLKNIVDLIHGNAHIDKKTGHASGDYTSDVSQYVIGWILGIEPEATMVQSTNELNPDKTSFEGKYLTCSDIQPYEVFWCKIGDYVLSYEDSAYSIQRPISFTNWPTGDIISHPDEPIFEAEDAISLNVEDIKITENYKAGLFASYHIYPYYPNFIFCDEKYKDYVDEDGNPNTYKAYLEDLIKVHNCPVLVSEFGIPTSRGVTHVNTVTQFNQGKETEQEQGEMLVSMFEDIEETGYAGALVFSWQDEWFKRTWNTMDSTNAQRRAYWEDVQTCEQHFGLLEFVPGATKQTCIIDGNTNDWTDSDLLYSDNDGNKYYSKVDCSYLYLMIGSKTIDYNNGDSSLYFDITPNSGSTKYENTVLDTPADFVLNINGQNNTRMLVQNYYDQYSYLYNEYDSSVDLSSINKNSNIFNKIYLITDRAQYLPKSDILIPMQKEETGLMTFGISDYDSDEYNSLSDFYIKDNILEIRIPWGLLQFKDPSTKEIMGDFWENDDVEGMNINSISIGAIVKNKNMGGATFTWDNWDTVYYHTRLKQSYYIIKDYLTSKN